MAKNERINLGFSTVECIVHMNRLLRPQLTDYRLHCIHVLLRNDNVSVQCVVSVSQHYFVFIDPVLIMYR